MDLIILHQKALDLYRIQVLTTGNDNVFLTVYQEDEAVLILTGHITGKEPAVLKYLGCSLRVLVVFNHDARALNAELTDLTLLNGIALFINNLGLPSISGNTDGTYLVNILHTKVYTAGTCGL